MKRIKPYFYIRTLYYAHIYDIIIDKFIELNPPCKECLVQNMCIFAAEYIEAKNEVEDKIASKIFVKACKKLDEFMKKEKWFKGSWEKK